MTFVIPDDMLTIGKEFILKMKIKSTIIFDMDGVISDSMPFHAKAWKEAFGTIGVDVDDFEIYIREGMKG
ncbi:MAG TPA: hypothetical protein VI387_07915, partial [Candidatus Brocadiales bacterium]|nr:hypothetical protein [Candidatus Brocadiales bacterium]